MHTMGKIHYKDSRARDGISAAPSILFNGKRIVFGQAQSSTVKDVDQDYPTVSKIRHEPSQFISHQDGQSLMGKFEMFHSIQINAVVNLHPSAKRYLMAEL